MAAELLKPEHELFRSPDQTRAPYQILCFGCGEWLPERGPTYSCRHCRILLHENCAVNLPTTIPNHPFHRKHSLELVANPTSSHRGKCRCIFCLDTIDGILAYRCSANCDLTLHVKCATSSKFTVGNFPEYDHFGHQHPLVSFQNNTDELAGTLCVICEESLTGPIHCCTDCDYFRLHTKCLDFQREIRHRSHRKHRLLLQVLPSRRPSRRICDVCDHPCRLVVYNCRSCDFDIHVKCASPPPTLTCESHPHSFDLLLRKCWFLCDGCGRAGEGAPYLCRKCNLVLHKKCVSLPKLSKVKQHHHPLAHKFSLLGEEISRDSIICQLCRGNVDPKHGCYCCSETDCDFMAHVSCVIDVNAVDRSFGKELPQAVAESSSSSSSSAAAPSQACSVDDDSTAAIDKQNRQPLLKVLEWETTQDGLRRPTKIKHFCHDRDLTRGGQVPPSDEIQCFACVKPVTDIRYFSCSESEVFLHEICAFQPRKYKHWLHDHTLSLGYHISFTCNTCRYHSTGLHYRCEVCNRLIICLHCKLIPEVFTPRRLSVAGHIHSLCYDHKYEDRPCSGCGNLCGEGIGHGLNFRAFRCRDCDLFVDFPCLILPTTARHEYHDHPLTLSFEDSEHDPARCVCNICDGYRDSKHWFYSCKECESTPSYFKAHCKCVLGKYPFIKIWSQFDGRPAHQHPLTVYRVNDYPQCGRCKDYIEEVALKCEESECNYALHWECLFLTPGRDFSWEVVTGLNQRDTIPDMTDQQTEIYSLKQM